MNLPIKKTKARPDEQKIFNQIISTIGQFETNIISSYPWAITYRLENGSGTYFLKLYAPGNTDTLIKNQHISKYFSQECPEIVLADPEQGFLLSKHHGGLALNRHPTPLQLHRLMKHYACIQVVASTNHEVQQALPNLTLPQIFQNFMDFLNPESGFVAQHPGWVNASFFISPEEALGYYQIIKRRKDLLTTLFDKAASLPDTLNHCDLHTQNAAETHEGGMVFFDWDDAVIAPAGLSLHLLFNQCSNIFRLLDNENPLPEALALYQDALITYIGELVDNGYAKRTTLHEALPATACAGVMYSLSCYARYPKDDPEYKDNIGTLFRERLEDLTNLCDLLALKSRDAVIYCANDYSQNGIPGRSAYLLNQYLQHHPNDLELQQFSAEINMHLGQWPDAINNYQQLLASNPYDASAYAGLGDALLKNQQPELAIKELENALALEPNHHISKENINKCGYILQSKERARIPHLAPAMQRFPRELQQNTVDIENLDLATSLFREHGMVVVENLFPAELMRGVSALVMEKYTDYFEDKEYSDNLVLGDKRRMVTLEIEGPLNHPQIYGNALLNGLMQHLLDDDYVMGGLNAVVSLPGSQDQAPHKDYVPLFRNEAIENHVSPSFAVGLLTPLIDMRREHGVTRFRKGSHLLPEQMPYHLPTQEPLLKMGDGVIFDYRTTHEGLANHSNEIRPLLCIVFHRIWFRDALNYNQQEDLVISKNELEKIPDHFKQLFKWTAA